MKMETETMFNGDIRTTCVEMFGKTKDELLEHFDEANCIFRSEGDTEFGKWYVFFDQEKVSNMYKIDPVDDW